MRNAEYFRGKRITIAGLARSGLACANLLYDLGADISITEYGDNESVRLEASKLKSSSIRIELGRHSQEFIRNRDILVVSPGIPDAALPVVWARQYSIPVISEIEVAAILCPGIIIAITGTNGKTTVTTLIGKILEEKGKKVSICGNIGAPFCSQIRKMREGDFVSLEVSSFQLEKIKTFKPKISVILNFSRNHLDRYNNMEGYLAAKKRIFMNQDKNDYLVLNYEDQMLKNLAKEAKAKVVYFSKDDTLNPNQSAVLVVGSILGIDKDSILKVFREFKGVEHRLEYVTEIGGIKFINDSKSTTVESSVWALKNIPGDILLIAGGREKGNDYNIILDLIHSKVRELILIGEAKDRLRQRFKGLLPIDEADSLEEAVDKSFKKAKPGNCVLLSPMCKSFDMFSDYEERGRVFKEAVRKLNSNVKIKISK